MEHVNIDYAAMLQDLNEWCAINSGSTNLIGMAQMHQRLFEAFKPLSDNIESIPLPDVTSISMTGELTSQAAGHALLIRKRPHLKRRILLSGHMDTVFGVEHPFQTLQQLDDNIINGPGVADMKGGLVVMRHALQAFEQSTHAHTLGWDVIISTDEEIGSNASNSLLMNIAKSARAALVYEPAITPDGRFAKNRKGDLKVTLVTTGLAAHSGRDFDKGRNAICYLADIIMSIQALNGQREGLTLNIGKIAGGTALNIVPDKAVAQLDIRLLYPEDEVWVREQLNIIQQQHQKTGYSLSVTHRYDRPVKRVNKPTEQLFTRLQTLAQSHQLQLTWEDCGGCCDGNNLAQLDIAVLDSLGVRGGNIHTSAEYILLDSLIERAKLSAYLLDDLARGGLETIY
jgi:glutamate carboxypeptidase